MNALQSFMAECNRQTRAINQEQVVINNSTFFGSFGDAQMLPVMVGHGYENLMVVPFLAPAEQFATPPKARQNLTRSSNNAVYFIQMIDTKDPVVFTFILVDRDPEA